MNFKKILSFALLNLLALSAFSIHASAEEIVSDVGTTSSYAETESNTFSVSVPSSLPIVIGGRARGVGIYAEIKNSGDHEVMIKEMYVIPSANWKLVDFDKDFSTGPANLKEFGFQINGINVPTDGVVDVSCFETIPANDSLYFYYDANIAPQITNLSASVGEVVFVMGLVEKEAVVENPIPEGAIYYSNGDGEVTTITEGKSFPETVNVGDVYIFQGYEYHYGMSYDGTDWVESNQNGWSVKYIDDSEIAGLILDEVNGIQVTNMDYTYFAANNLSFEDGFEIPYGVTSMHKTFAESTLVGDVYIPETVTNMSNTFEGATFLGVVVVDATPETYESCFANSIGEFMLIGSSEVLKELAETSSGNITVEGEEIPETKTEESEAAPEGEQPDEDLENSEAEQEDKNNESSDEQEEQPGDGQSQTPENSESSDELNNEFTPENQEPNVNPDDNASNESEDAESENNEDENLDEPTDTNDTDTDVDSDVPEDTSGVMDDTEDAESTDEDENLGDEDAGETDNESEDVLENNSQPTTPDDNNNSEENIDDEEDIPTEDNSEEGLGNNDPNNDNNLNEPDNDDIIDENQTEGDNQNDDPIYDIEDDTEILDNVYDVSDDTEIIDGIIEDEDDVVIEDVEDLIDFILFTINNEEYTSEADWTWEDWINSEYNVDGIYVNELDEIVFVDADGIEHIVEGACITDVILENTNYNIVILDM